MGIKKKENEQKVKKIKKFKIKINPWFVEQRLKSQDFKQASPEIKKIISEKIKEVESSLLPATVYETFKPEEILPLITSAELESSLKNCVALSLFVVTLGVEPRFKEEISYFNIYQAVIQSAAEQAAHFVYRLINEEAKKENHILGPRIDISSEKKVREILELLDVKRIGVILSNDFKIQSSMRVELVPWLVKKRTKEIKK